ncbi:MAG: TonB-dependent receptor, partial [Campylobacteraceae bacterium]|nr:TonB-dependent receptor [Campylobacteraceae bacterium]
NDFIISYNEDKDKYQEKTNILPEVSTVYHIDKNNHIKLLFGKANQLAYSSIEDYEEIKSLELSYLYINKYFLFNTSIFNNKTKNISLFVQKRIANRPKVIEGELESKGIEVALKYKNSENFQTSSSISFQKSKSISKLNNLYLDPAFSPQILAKTDMTYAIKNLSYSFIINYISSMKSSIINDDNQRYGKKIKNNITVSTNINYKYNKNLSLDFHINNLLNKKNKVPAGSTLTSFRNGFFTKDREVFLTATYKF